MSLDGRTLPAYVRAWLDGNGCPPERAAALEGQVQALVDACEPYGGLRWPDGSLQRISAASRQVSFVWKRSSEDYLDSLWLRLRVRPTKTSPARAHWYSLRRHKHPCWIARETDLDALSAAYAARALNITHGPAPL